MATLLDIVKKGSTDRSVAIRIIDDTTGVPETGVEHNTSGVDLWYRREGAAKTSITEAALSALTDAHSDGGIEHVGNGEYRLDLPDAAFASGANYVDIGGTVTGMIVIGGRVRLVNYDPEDTVRLGLTALPNAAADAPGGLPISDAGGLDLDQIKASLDDVVDAVTIYSSAASSGTTTTLVDAGLTQADDYWNGCWVKFTSGNNIGQVRLITDFVAGTDTITFAPAVANAVTTHSYVIIPAAMIAWNPDWDAEVQSEAQDAIEANHLDHLLAQTYDPASKPGAADALLNELVENDGGVSRYTANALEQAPSGGSAPTVEQIRTEMDDNSTKLAGILEDTGTTLDGLIDAIKAKTDNLPSDPADQSALEAAITVVGNYVDTEVGAIKTVVDAIKVITDALTAAAAAKLALSAGTIVAGTVDNTGHSPTATEFEADDITEATADHYNGRIIIFTSGALLYQATSISDYSLASGRGHFTVVALTEAPGNNDTFIVV